jgi:hypothetical protein
MRLILALLWTTALGGLSYVVAIHADPGDKRLHIWVILVTLLAFVSVYLPRWKVFAFATALPFGHGLAVAFQIAFQRATYQDLITTLLLDAVVVVIVLLPTLVLGKNFDKKFS